VRLAARLLAEPGTTRMAIGVDWELAAALVIHAQQGDTLAMTELLELVHPFVVGVCQAIAGRWGEDAAQETLIIAFRRLAGLRDPTALRAWLRTVATREALRLASPDPLPLDDIQDLVGEEFPFELRHTLTQALTGLTAQQRAALVLRDVEGLSEREVACLLNVPTGTVKSRLHRARLHLRREWLR
jgi:RNA polymerase sigma factor (sigma-70 family)